MEARFPAPVQTGPGSHPAFYAMDTGTFPEIKRPGSGVDHPPHLAPTLSEAQGYTLLALWTFVACSRVNLTFTFTLPYVSYGLCWRICNSIVASSGVAVATFLGEFANLRIATISFVMSVRPPVRPHEKLCSHRKDFKWILYLSIFRKSVEKIQDLLKSDNSNRHSIRMNTNVHLRYPLAEL